MIYMMIKIIAVSISIVLFFMFVHLIYEKYFTSSHVKVLFITGTSGSGKTTLTNKLKELLSVKKYAVYDFDEVGVPENADALWRQSTTQYWVNEAIKNSKNGLSTIICGVIVPQEVMSIQVKEAVPIKFVFLKINNTLIMERLKSRGWTDQLIQDNINWAYYLEKDVVSHGGFIIECSKKNVDEIGLELQTILKNLH